MQKPAKKTYKTPKLTTHGGVEKLTQSSHSKPRPRKAPPSSLVSNGRGHGHGDD